MKILEPQSAILSNYEVLTHINSVREKQALYARNQKNENVQDVLKQVADYLSPFPRNPAATTSALPAYKAPDYSERAIFLLTQRLKPYLYTSTNTEGLYKHEVLMILNLRPKELGLLDCVVEECDERFTERQQEEILEIVAEVLGRDEEEEDVNGNGHVEEGNVDMEGNG